MLLGMWELFHPSHRIVNYEFKMFMKLPIFLQLLDVNKYVKLAESSAKLCTYLKFCWPYTSSAVACRGVVYVEWAEASIMNQTYLVEMGLLARTEHFIRRTE